MCSFPPPKPVISFAWNSLSLLTCCFLSFKSQFKCHLERSKHSASNYQILETKAFCHNQIIACVICSQSTNGSIISKCPVYRVGESLTWPLTFWSLHFWGIWQSSDRLDLGRGWAGEGRWDDVSLRRKLECSKTPCQEPSFFSPLWFLICSFMSSDSEGKRINFQSDPKALQDHH